MDRRVKNHNATYQAINRGEKMEIKTFNKKFNSLIEQFFLPYGFTRKKENFYQKDINDVQHIINFSPIFDKKTGCISITSGGYGIRIPMIESMMNPDSNIITIGMPLHLIKPEKKYYEFSFHSENEIDKKIIYLIKEINDYGFMFLDKFQDSKAIYSSLKSDNPNDWFMCSESNRDSLIVCFEYFYRGKIEAIKIGRELLQKYEDKLPKYSIPLVTIISKIERLVYFQESFSNQSH